MMLKTLSRAMPFVVSMAIVVPAAADEQATDPAVFAAKLQSCSACHGENGGKPILDYPILAGQYPDYLAQALRDYRAGRRKNPVMSALAVGLSDSEIEQLATFFGSQEGLLNLRY